MPSNEIFARMFFSNMGIGTLRPGIGNFTGFGCSVGHHCDFSFLYFDLRGMCGVFLSSRTKILTKLKRRSDHENCCVSSAKLLKRSFSLDFPSEKIMLKGLQKSSPFFLVFF